MKLDWSQKLSVGNAQIDKQHQELFKRVNNLIDAMNQRKGKDEVGKIIKFLESYVIEHFGAEEKAMAACNYPKLAAHRMDHGEFTGSFNTIKKKFEEKGPTADIVILIHSQLGKWLLRHIPSVDKDLAGFLGAKELKIA